MKIYPVCMNKSIYCNNNIQRNELASSCHKEIENVDFLKLIPLSVLLVNIKFKFYFTNKNKTCSKLVIRSCNNSILFKLLIVTISITQQTRLAWAGDVMMVQAKTTYILMIKVKKLFPFFTACFVKEMENMFMFLLSCWNTGSSLGELKKAVETLTTAPPTAFLILPNFHLCFYLNNRVFLSWKYRLMVAPWKFDVLKTNISLRSESSRANIIAFRASNFQGGGGNYQTDSSEM